MAASPSEQAGEPLRGRRTLDRKAFFVLVQTAIRQGAMRPTFYTTDERVTFGDRVAAVNSVNHGSYATLGGFKDIAWIESVTLRRISVAWRIDFLSSQARGDFKGLRRRHGRKQASVSRRSIRLHGRGSLLSGRLLDASSTRRNGDEGRGPVPTTPRV